LASQVSAARKSPRCSAACASSSHACEISRPGLWRVVLVVGIVIVGGRAGALAAPRPPVVAARPPGLQVAQQRRLGFLRLLELQPQRAQRQPGVGQVGAFLRQDRSSWRVASA
jgi:hypothetical protein